MKKSHITLIQKIVLFIGRNEIPGKTESRQQTQLHMAAGTSSTSCVTAQGQLCLGTERKREPPLTHLLSHSPSQAPLHICQPSGSSTHPLAGRDLLILVWCLRNAAQPPLTSCSVRTFHPQGDLRAQHSCLNLFSCRNISSQTDNI